ncbi:DUF1254 domain-containing protein [Methylobacterium goesingense]|uniref:DUF1254 domain-containing protein n=1 Tax=Methylobacterium goesingense TaxID=243690 RepID=UPI003570A385
MTVHDADMLYTSAFIDVGAELYSYSIPEEDGCYFLTQMLSAWTNVFAAPANAPRGRVGRPISSPDSAEPGTFRRVPSGSRRQRARLEFLGGATARARPGTTRPTAFLPEASFQIRLDRIYLRPQADVAEAVQEVTAGQNADKGQSERASGSPQDMGPDLTSAAHGPAAPFRGGPSDFFAHGGTPSGMLVERIMACLGYSTAIEVNCEPACVPGTVFTATAAAKRP